MDLSARARRLATFLIGAAAAYFVARVLLAYPRVAAEAAASAPTASAAATIAPLLGPGDFAALGDRIGPDFGVTADGAIAFSAGGALHALARGGRTQTIDIDGDPPESFVVDASGPMLGIVDGYLGLLGEDRRFGAARPLPKAPMRLAPSVRPGVFYLSGGAAGDYRLYRFIDDGALQLLMASHEPIVDAADSARDVYAATASEILKIRAGQPDVLFHAPDDDFGGPIRSLAVAEDDLVLFSTDTKVYALLGGAAISIVNDAGGILRIRGDALYVLDPKREILFALRPASSRLFDAALK
ncbi:MAG: hypothetical protein ABR970_13770 [Roseiarcus sp.]|jgi:hypothetical protein